MKNKNAIARYTGLLSIFIFMQLPLHAQTSNPAYAYLDSLKATKANTLFADNTRAVTDAETEAAKDQQLFDNLNVSLNKRTDRKALMQVLQTLKLTGSSNAVAAKSKVYYHLANVFMHLRLYPLAMKCFFKTIPVTDTINQAMADTGYTSKDYLSINAVDDSVLSKQPLVLTSVIESNEKSEPIAYQNIVNTFKDSKRAAGYALLFHVKQPVAGKPKIFTGTNTGHTFITLIKYNTDSTYVSLSFGFYPKKKNILSATPIEPATSSVFKNDSKHKADEVLGKFISKRRFEKILALTKQYNGLEYHLSKNNCTDFGIKAAGLAGISVDGTSGKWLLGHGNNPGITGQSILQGKFNDLDSGKANTLFVDTIKSEFNL